MKLGTRNIRTSFATIAILLLSPLADAHLMVAQQGTLNVVDRDVYMVLSLPISAFAGIDQNEDGQVSMIELNQHRKNIVAAINEKVSLRDGVGVATLTGLTLSPVLPHSGAGDAVDQLIVMGRFELQQSNSSLHFHVGLFGQQAAERELQITVTRRADQQRQVLKLSPQEQSGEFF